MKRTDAFMLGLTVFVAANCISYFVRSGTPYMSAWGMPDAVVFWHEEIGFPFVMFHVGAGIVSFMYWSWINVLGNTAVAIVFSCLFSLRIAKYLPPLWPERSRVFRYSIAELLAGVTMVCILLGIAMVSPSWGLLVKKVVYFAGPVCAYGWFLTRRHGGWVYLTAAPMALTLAVLAIEIHYQELPQSEYQVKLTIWLTAARTVAPIFGLLSLLVIVHAAYDVIRHYYFHSQ